MPYFLQGLTMGLAYVAPIGVQNLFVINAGLTHPRRRALLTAGIVVFFDVTLALACFFGVGALLEAFPKVQLAVLLVGSLIVLAMGVGLVRTKEAGEQARALPDTWRKTITTACVVTWFNPQAILDGTMMLGAFRVTLPAAQASPFIIGVALASCLWFTGLTTAVGLLRRHINGKILRRINQVCGLVILFYGGKLLWSFFTMLTA